MLCWIAAPTMFAAIALSVVSTKDYGLSPSVAFTSLAIFQRLEATLSLIPVFVTDFVDARVSVGRIEEFLASPEREDTSIDSDIIAFEGATIYWPMDAEFPGRFALRNVDLVFPRHGLSIIIGPTGVGKSLMLAAIVGEADVLHGNIRRPRRSLEADNQIIGSSGKDWIVPKAMAFVAQTPWIENATLRDNILFGLPFYESRYWKVLHACALLQDMRIMDEGDMTEIGSHGINLSGGQRSRLSLARALYSRAETLVLDDIFSAVDAHVGRHLLEHALDGPLTEGRTCILATHHAQLCMTRAKFIVLLNDGSVVFAGQPEQSSLKGSNDAHEATDDAVQPTFKALDTISNEDSSSPNRTSVATSLHESIGDADVQVKISAPDDRPKKLVEDERYQKGRIKSSVYSVYLRAASNWPWLYWTTVLCVLVGSVSLAPP